MNVYICNDGLGYYWFMLSDNGSCRQGSFPSVTEAIKAVKSQPWFNSSVKINL